MPREAECQTPAPCLDDTKRREPPHTECQCQGEHAVEERSHANPRDHVHFDAQPKITAFSGEHQQVGQTKRCHRREENLPQQLPGQTNPSNQ